MLGSFGVTGRGQLFNFPASKNVLKWVCNTLHEAQGTAQRATSLNYPICPRARASPPEVYDEIALYLCGSYLEWWIENWGCELSYFTDAEELVGESEQPQAVRITQTSLISRTPTCASNIRWQTLGHYPCCFLSTFCSPFPRPSPLRAFVAIGHRQS